MGMNAMDRQWRSALQGPDINAVEGAPECTKYRSGQQVNKASNDKNYQLETVRKPNDNHRQETK